MTKDNKLEQREYDKYYELKEYLGRLQDEYQTCHIRYMNESDTRQRAMARRDLDEISLRIRRTQQEMNKIKNSIHLKDSMDILKLSGFTVDSRVSLDLRHQNIDYEKAKQLALKKEQELKSKYKNVKLVMKMPTNSYFEWEVSNETNDEEVSSKFKKVMEEYGKGELKSSSGEKVTDPKQAKAIAYSEAGESKDGYKMDDPKEIEAAIKKVKASGHPNPQYLAGLERALEIAKQERGMKDSCGEKVFTKGTEDGGPGSGIKGHTTESSEEKFWENKLREVAKQKGISESDIEELISQVKKGGAKSILTPKDGNKDDDATEGGAIREYGDKDSEKMEDACSTKDADPRVVDAEAMIKLCGGVM